MSRLLRDAAALVAVGTFVVMTAVWSLGLPALP
jgi:hypothetical protein